MTTRPLTIVLIPQKRSSHRTAKLVRSFLYGHSRITSHTPHGGAWKTETYAPRILRWRIGLALMVFAGLAAGAVVIGGVL